MSDERYGTIAVLLAAIGYGFLGVLIKLALKAGASVIPLATWRFSLAAVMIWLLLGARRRPLPGPGTWPCLAALGALYAINALAFIAALQWIEASTATLVFYTYPVVVVLLAAAFLDEGLSSRKVIGTALAVIGCALTAGASARGGDPLGIGLVLVAMASLSVYIVTSRRLLDRVPSHGAAAIIVTATAVVMIAIALATEGLSLGGGERALRIVVLLALVSTALPITLFVIGLKRIGAGRAAVYSTVEPVVTVIAAATILGERIGVLAYLGGGLILLGVAWLRLERPLPRSEELTPLDAP